MSYDTLVCRDCGHDHFEQTRTTRTEYVLQNLGGCWVEVEESVVDGGDMGDHDIICADCGAEVYSDDDLVSAEDYSAA